MMEKYFSFCLSTVFVAHCPPLFFMFNANAIRVLYLLMHILKCRRKRKQIEIQIHKSTNSAFHV